MKVTGSGPAGTDRPRDIGGSRGVGQAGAGREKHRGEAAEGAAGEKVAISGKARDAAKAQAVARSAPDVDEAKVARLKAAIRDGSYQVDADKVADRLVDEHLTTPF